MSCSTRSTGCNKRLASLRGGRRVEACAQVAMYKKTVQAKFPTLKKYSDLSKEPTATHVVSSTKAYYRQSDFTEERTPVLKDGSEEVPAEQRLRAFRVRPVLPVLAVGVTCIVFRPVPIYNQCSFGRLEFKLKGVPNGAALLVSDTPSDLSSAPLDFDSVDILHHLPHSARRMTGFVGEGFVCVEWVFFWWNSMARTTCRYRMRWKRI